ncbi:MAG: hypothetical protein RR405_02025, partial [Clostridia bacterium]
MDKQNYNECEECEKDEILQKNTDNDEGNKPKSADIEQQTQNFGKFKNPNELLHAYCELEKEFTKRSQRLAMLENGVKKSDGNNAKSSQDEGGESVKSETVNNTLENDDICENNDIFKSDDICKSVENAVETEDEWR